MWAAVVNFFKAAPKSTWGIVLNILSILPELYRQYKANQETRRQNQRVDLIVKRDKLQDEYDAAVARRDADEIDRLHVELDVVTKRLFKL
jgi:hypothetical protein